MGDHILKFILICSGTAGYLATESGKSYIQECTNCIASGRCGRYTDSWQPLTRDDCFEKLNNKGYVLMAYHSREQKCKAFNCTVVKENDRYSIVMKTYRSDCLRYTITTKKQHEGNYFRSVGAYAFIPDEDICLQSCLHFNGCMGSTYKKMSQTCVLHGSNDSSYQRSGKEMTFVGITCLDNAAQLKTPSSTSLPVFPTNQTETTPDSISMLTRTTSISPDAMVTLPMSAPFEKRTTQSIRQEATTQQSIYNMSSFVAMNSSVIPHSEETSLTSRSLSSISPISLQADTKAAYIGLTIHDSASSSVLTFTRYSNSDTYSGTVKQAMSMCNTCRNKDPMLYLQECTNCKVHKAACRPDIGNWENITKYDCFAKINVEGYQLLEYQITEHRCKAYNCTNVRYGTIRFSTRMKTNRSDCLRYELTRRWNHVGICPSFEVNALILNEYVCFQRCLHVSGCFGLTYEKSNQICSLHSCNESLNDRSSNGDQVFTGIICLDMHLTSRQPPPSLMSSTSWMSSVKHNLTSQFPVKDKTSQLETHTVSTLLALTTSLANIKQNSMPFISKTNRALSSTIPVPISSTMATRLTPFMEPQTTALTTGHPQRQFRTNPLTYNYSRFIIPTFSIVRTEETHSLKTKLHPLVSVSSVQAETTGTITGLTADSATSLSSMSVTMTLYSKSVIQPTTAITESTTTPSKSSDQFQSFDTTVGRSNEIHVSDADNFFSNPVNRLAIPISTSVVVIITVIFFVYCATRKKWKVSNISKTL